MNSLSLFNFESRNVRVLSIDGEPWFVAKDVCAVLGIANTADALTRLDEDEKNTIVLNDGIPGNPNTSVVNESGFYSLVLSSRKAIAKPFKRWVTHEVLPSIRKTGGYTIDDRGSGRMSPAKSGMAAAGEAIDIAFAHLDINPMLVAGLKLNAIASVHPELDGYLEEGRKFIAAHSPIEEELLTPTALGEKLGISARAINKLLVEAGLQYND